MRGVRPVHGHHRGLVDEPASDPRPGVAGGADGARQRKERSPVILHSDRGCQFTSGEYQWFLKGHNLICSMSAVDSCADNASMEGFFGMLKQERVNRRRYQTRAEARADVFDYIERFYNTRRRRQLEAIKRGGLPLTQLPVETG